MSPEEVKRYFSEINIWKRGGERAPHKPLLLLYSLARADRGEPRLQAYKETRKELMQLLSEFGPSRLTKASYPFVRLQNDHIWELAGLVSIDSRSDWGDKALVNNNTMGGFNEVVYSALKQDKNLIREIAGIILEQSFPETIHQDILDAVGLSLEISRNTLISTSIKPRSPEFRHRVLLAYEYSCAVCGFNVRLGDTLVAVEAAHIKWHQAGGPDAENNGIALCTMHHKLFDRGVFTLTPSRILKVSDRANGAQGLQEWLMKYHDKPVREPQRPEYYPMEKYTEWHFREVFRGEVRYSAK